MSNRSSTNFDKQDEQCLIEQLKAGNPAAWRETMTLYGGAMLSIARNFSPHQADDIVQEAWIAAYKGMERFEGRASLKTWLIRIVMNCAYSYLRRKNTVLSLEGLEPQHDPLDGAFLADGHWRQRFESWTDDSPQALLESHALGDCLERHFDALPTGQRMALLLRDIDGLGADEICETLNIKPSHFRVLLHRARVRVHSMVSNFQATGEC